MKKKIVTGMAIAIILLLAGCDAVGNENIDNTITNVPNGKDNPDPDPDARLSVEIPEEAFSDPDYVWVREFAQEFLEFLKEPYTPTKDDGPRWYNLYGDIETFYREKAAWEKQNTTSYKWSYERAGWKQPTMETGWQYRWNKTVRREVLVENDPPVSDDHDVEMGRDFSKLHIEATYNVGQSLPPYWHPISIGNEIIIPGVPSESYSVRGPGAFVPYYENSLCIRAVYDRIRFEIEDLTRGIPILTDDPSLFGKYSRYRAGFKIDYDPVYHYPQRILWIQWCPDWITNHPDPLYKYPKLVYGIVKVLSFEPLESEPTPSDGKEVLPLEPETKQEY